jgi:branched-chain amino acid transport system substrate-binding protein
MQMNRRLSGPIAAFALLLAACQSTPAPAPQAAPTQVPTPSEEPAPTATPIVKGQIFKIYSSLPLTGENAAKATGIVNAINLAIEKQTDSGTLCDGIFKINYVSLDDANPATGAWDLLTEEANDNKANGDVDAMAFIGPFDSGAARVAAPVLNKGSLATISPAADYVGLTRKYAPSDPDVYFEMGKRNFMRLVPPISAQGAAAAKWSQTLGASKVFIVDDGEQYGLGPSDAFKSAAAQAGVQVVGRELINQKADNLPYVASKFMIAGADFIYYGGSDPTKAGLFLKEARKENIQAKMIGTSALMAKAFTDAAGDLAQGFYVTSPGLPIDKLPAKGQQFVKDYQSRYNAKPDIYAVYGYEAASVILATTRTVCQKDRVALLDAMFNTLDFDGVLGKWSFDDSGDINLLPLQGNQFDKGAWVVTGALDTQ